jgi:hypothetical protein
MALKLHSALNVKITELEAARDALPGLFNRHKSVFARRSTDALLYEDPV